MMAISVTSRDLESAAPCEMAVRSRSRRMDSGFRARSRPRPIRPILAVGDSFTYGEGVADLDAWPAQLQRLTGRTVLNGGVSGYGLDQIVLRTERLTALHGLALVIVGMIANDVQRTEMRRMWWHDKPWFALQGGKLVLRGIPVPERTKPPTEVRRRMERLLVELPPALQHFTGYSIRVHRAGTGAHISRALIERLANLQTVNRVKLVLVAQYDADAWSGRRRAQEQRNVLRPLWSVRHCMESRPWTRSIDLPPSRGQATSMALST